MVLRGFLIKWVIDGAWDAYYYILMGGPLGIIYSQQQNSSVISTAQTLALYSWTGIITSTISLALMVLFIIRGTIVAIGEQRSREIEALPTSAQ